MDLFRLTYFVGGPDIVTKWDCNHRFEVFGSAESIFDLWFHLLQLSELSNKGIHPSACPCFVEVFNKDGDKQDISKGLIGLFNCNTFK